MQTPQRMTIEIENGRTIMRTMHNGMIGSDMEILMVLKGTTNSGTARVHSLYWPRQGEHYLVFANYNDETKVYGATDQYRVVPLGMGFPTNDLFGRELDEQIRYTLEWRLNNLNRDLEKMLEEKNRLEDRTPARKPFTIPNRP